MKYVIFKDKLNKTKILTSLDYNYIFNMENGSFYRWGRQKSDNPEYCKFGPEIIDIEQSTICSRECSWCYKSNSKTGTYMTFEQFQRIFDKLPKTVTQIAFGIGDVDNNEDLWQIMEYCRKNDVIPNVTINGDKLSDKIINKLITLTGAVAVSCYDNETCFNAVDRLTTAGHKQVNIHKLLSEETYEECLSLIDKVKSDRRLMHLKNIVFLWLKPKGDRNTYHQLSNKEQYTNLVNKAFNNGIGFGFDSCSAKLFLDVIKDRKDFAQIEPMVEPCESTLFSYYINAEGKGFPCSFTEGLTDYQGIDMLSINDFIKDVWNHEETLKFRNLNLTKKCESCVIYNLGYNKVKNEK